MNLNSDSGDMTCTSPLRSVSNRTRKTAMDRSVNLNKFLLTTEIKKVHRTNAQWLFLA